MGVNGEVLTDSFTNLPGISWFFWYGTEDVSKPTTSYFTYQYNVENTGSLVESQNVFAIFVTDGDIASVPLPHAVLFLVSGLLGLLIKRRSG